MKVNNLLPSFSLHFSDVVQSGLMTDSPGAEGQELIESSSCCMSALGFKT